ncbi:protein of eukaryotic translation initiation factor SUI1 family [Pseudohyphozyma bogoriensis]|nr:protein of eukaryotic translation initiation factor SUI1 family [Pseudohyphozyma bogoriensis]
MFCLRVTAAFGSVTSTSVSDLRRLRTHLSSVYPALTPALATSLLPDGSTASKALTHLDEHIIIYSQPENGEPVFVKLGKEKDDAEIVPTVYTLERAPDLLPSVVTAKEVVEVLVGGAALFSSGIWPPTVDALPDDLKRDSLLAIRAGGEIVGVGRVLGNKKELKAMVSERQGKAIATLHARGDYLWKMGSGNSLPQLESLSIDSPDSPPASTSSTSAGPPPPAPTTTETPSEPANDAATPTTLSPEAHSATLLAALLLALRTSPPPSSSLPLTAAALYASHVLPFRPAAVPGNAAEVKKSSYKNVKGMFKAVAKTGVLSVKEMKGDLVVVSIDAKHDSIESSRGYKTVSQAASQASKAAAVAEEAAATTDDSKGKGKVVVREVLKPGAVLGEFLDALGGDLKPKHDLYAPPALKALLTGHINAQGLTHKQDGRYFVLDGLLAGAVGSGAGAGWETQGVAKPKVAPGKFKIGDKEGEVMGKEDGWKRLVGRCEEWFVIESPSLSKDVVKKGKPMPIKIQLKTVGKRMVTLITGFEVWGDYGCSLEKEELAEDLRKRAASSTSVSQMTGSSPKKPLYEVMVQGSHEVLVTKTLVERGVPKQYIVVDTSKVKK